MKHLGECSPLPGRPSRGLAAKLSVGLVFGAVFFWLAFRQASWEEILGTLRELRPLPLFGALICQFASLGLRAVRWKVLLSVGHPGLGRHKAFAALMVGYAVNAVLPRGGEVARVFYLRRTVHTPLAAGFSSVLSERLIDVVSLALLFPFVVVLYENRLESLFPGMGNGVLLVGAISAVVLGMTFFLSLRIEENVARSTALAERFRPAWSPHIARLSRSFLQGFAGLFRRDHLAAIVGLSGAIWLLSALTMWLLLFSLPFVGMLGFSFLDASALTVVAAAALVVPSPGGVGVIHFLLSQTLIGVFSIGLGDALAFATLVHAINVLPALAVGGAYAFFLVKHPASRTSGLPAAVSCLTEMDTQNGKDSL